MYDLTSNVVTSSCDSIILAPSAGLQIKTETLLFIFADEEHGHSLTVLFEIIRALPKVNMIGMEKILR